MKSDNLTPLQILGLIVVLVIGFALRYSYNAVTVNATPIQADAANYVRYASNIINHGTFSKDRRNIPPVPDSYWAPGYPAFLAGTMLLAHLGDWQPYEVVLVSQLLLGLLTVVLTFLIARQFLPGFWALLPPALVAISPHLIAIGHNVLTETLFSALLLLGLFSYLESLRTRRIFPLLLAGVVFAMAWAVNPVSLLVAPLLAVHYFLTQRSREKRSAAKAVLLCSLLVLPLAIVETGWSVRNQLVVPENSPTSSGRLLTNLAYGMHSDFHERWRANKRDPSNPGVIDDKRVGDSYIEFFRILAGYLLEKPLHMIKWYGIDKPIDLWDWEVKVGYRDIYIYPVEYSLYDRSRFAEITYVVMENLHYALLACAILGLFFTLRTRGQERDVTLVLYLASLYVCGVYIASQADPRYSFPLRPEMYLLATYFLWRAYRIATPKHRSDG